MSRMLPPSTKSSSLSRNSIIVGTGHLTLPVTDSGWRPVTTTSSLIWSLAVVRTAATMPLKVSISFAAAGTSSSKLPPSSLRNCAPSISSQSSPAISGCDGALITPNAFVCSQGLAVSTNSESLSSASSPSSGSSPRSSATSIPGSHESTRSIRAWPSRSSRAGGRAHSPFSRDLGTFADDSIECRRWPPCTPLVECPAVGTRPTVE
mmetsp:Transcript_21291/g.51147  ORF Transcript_21291/g.51147 Transcript_21291/m.51147 type:complete len:207 (+) Transcript_21291:286-906(+)